MTYDNAPDLIKIVEESIEVSKREGSKIPHEVAQLRGMSSPKIRHFLNQVCSYGTEITDCHYLELGTWGGSTFFPAVYGNNVRAIAVDDYSQFGPEECGGYDAGQDFRDRLEKYKDKLKYAELIPGNCFDPEVAGKVVVEPLDVFFYDGAHDTTSTHNAIVMYSRKKKPFILIVDDWVLTPDVQEGTKLALMQFTVHGFWELKKEDGHHEGVGIYVLEAK